MKRLRVLVVEDHHLVRTGLVAVISGTPGFVVAGEAADGDAALESYRALRPDVTLMDLRLPGRSGVEVVRAICAEDAGARILVLSLYEGDEDVRQALDAGALGYALKRSPAEALVEAIRAVASGERAVAPELERKLTARPPELTAREGEVLALLARGLDNAAIGQVLGISGGTVKIHVRHIFDKLGVHDRTHAIALALRRGLVHLE